MPGTVDVLAKIAKLQDSVNEIRKENAARQAALMSALQRIADAIKAIPKDSD